MNKDWILHVENFAKIKIADVQISPLMCFVGDMKSSVGYKTWREAIKPKVRTSFLNALAIADFLVFLLRR